MTRRRVLCGLLLASALVAGLGIWLVIASRPRVTLARFEQVEKGMSREEVIRMVGGPAGDYSTGNVKVLIIDDSASYYGLQVDYERLRKDKHEREKRAAKKGGCRPKD